MIIVFPELTDVINIMWVSTYDAYLYCKNV